MRQCGLSWDLLFLRFYWLLYGSNLQTGWSSSLPHFRCQQNSKKLDLTASQASHSWHVFEMIFRHRRWALRCKHTACSVAPSVAPCNHCSVRRGAKNSCHQCTWRQSFRLAASVIRPLKFRKLFFFLLDKQPLRRGPESWRDEGGNKHVER